jgi:hypothetical protein
LGVEQKNAFICMSVLFLIVTRKYWIQKLLIRKHAHIHKTLKTKREKAAREIEKMKERKIERER